MSMYTVEPPKREQLRTGPIFSKDWVSSLRGYFLLLHIQGTTAGVKRSQSTELEDGEK